MFLTNMYNVEIILIWLENKPYTYKEEKMANMEFPTYRFYNTVIL